MQAYSFYTAIGIGLLFLSIQQLRQKTTLFRLSTIQSSVSAAFPILGVVITKAHQLQSSAGRYHNQFQFWFPSQWAWKPQLNSG